MRAIQTAEILVRELDLTGFGDLPGLVEITDALREFECGVWEGESSRAHGDDYGRLFRDWQAGKWDSRIGGGESLLDVQARFLPFIEHLKLAIGGADNILLVSHGGTLLGALPVVLRNIDHAFAYTHHLGNTDVIIAEARPEGWVCLSWCGITF